MNNVVLGTVNDSLTLDEIRDTPLEHITAEKVAAVVGRIMQRDSDRVSVGVAAFQSSM